MKYLFFCLALYALISCKTIKPVAPAIELAEYVPPVQKASSIHIPVEMDLKSKFDDADKAVPYQFKGNEKNCEGVSFSYTFDRKPIKIVGKGKKVGIEIEGKYALNLNYCAKCSDMFSDEKSCVTPRIYVSCGVDEPMRRIKIEYETAIDLKPNFKLQSQTTLKEVTPKDKCEISVFRYDATGRLVKEVKKALKDLGKEIDKEVESLDVKKQAEEIWKTFSTPFPIENYGFLHLNPEKLAINGLKLNGSKLFFEVAIEAFPEVDLSKRNGKNTNLPDMSAINAREGLDINLNLVAQYDSLSSVMNRSLSGKVITIKKQKIILQEAKVHGAANRQLAIEISFAGSKSGKMFFMGTPHYNDSLQEISFPDLSFDLETKNTLLKSAKWLFNHKITDMVRSYAKFNMTEILLEASKKIELQMNGEIDKGIFLTGKMEQVRVMGIHPAQDKLIIESNLKGRLSVSIK